MNDIAMAIFAAIAIIILSGCIADNAEDTALPWASNRGWEGIAPISPTMMDRYD
jgi:hypothetical protein